MADKRLLIVDDVEEMGEYVRFTAEEMGYDVKVVTEAREFMRIIDGYDPTAVVVDIVMPDIDGLELIKWLRERGCKAKVIVASAVNEDYAKLARSLGKGRGLDISMVKKPFQINELYTALE
ncbi:MAG: response regulator [Alphaproteobacteria bacterium]|nr:response regulator [Alphaproteobacteria bacterium]